MVETITTCPLGSKCEEVKDGKIHKCAWFITLAGQNPQTGEAIDEKGCAMGWLPILLVENSRVAHGTGAAIESFRNEMMKSNAASMSLFLGMTNKKSELLERDHDAGTI
jgi:hypothetical protein